MSGAIIPSRYFFQMRDKTTIIDKVKRNAARKTLVRGNIEPPRDSKPIGSIISD